MADHFIFFAIRLDFVVVGCKSSTHLVRGLVARCIDFLVAGRGEKFQRLSRIRAVYEILLLGELGGGHIAGLVHEGRGVRTTPDLWGKAVMTRIAWVLSLLAAAGVDLKAGEDAGAGSVIYDNIAPNGGLNPDGASPASQYDAVFPFDAGATDDFILPESPLCTWTVTGVRWSGVYWGPEDPGIITGFRLIVWPDEAGDPAGGGGAVPKLGEALSVYEIAGRANETPNALGAPNTFDYFGQLPQPFHALPGIRYWIQIQPVMAFPPQWGWHVTHGRRGAGPVEYFDLLGLPVWTSIPDGGDLAFQILGEPREIPCDDANACTADTCVGASCVFTPIQCDDGNACTTDACDASRGCSHASLACDDHNACTEDICDPAVGCTHVKVTCDDGDACTVDTCDPASGCASRLLDCNDESACTTDMCVGGDCVFTPVVCDDGDACTIDACDASRGCTHASLTCDDHSACTKDTCDPAAGCAHLEVTCDDGDSCTVDSCDPAGGCVLTPVVCDDGNPCTGDICAGGVCEHSGPADLDGDGDVDVDDFSLMQGCMTSPGGGTAESQCLCADLSGDRRIDMLDYAAFQRVFTGK